MTAQTFALNMYEPTTPDRPNYPNESSDEPGGDEYVPDNGTPLVTRTPSSNTPSNVTRTTSPQATETIDDLSVPLASTPKTGDSRNLGLWVGIGVAALAGAGACGAGFIIAGRRRKKEEK